MNNETFPESVLVYGGAFDPLTMGHVSVIEAALEQTDYEEIWIMPCRDRLDKTPLVHELTRLDMLKKAVEIEFEDPRVKVSNFEIRLPRPTTLFATNKELTQYYQGTRFAYLVGSDSVQNIDSWHESEFIKSLIEWVVSPRNGYDLDHLPSNFSILEAVDSEISSTLVRDRASKGQNYQELVPKSVSIYIKERGLYGNAT